MTTETKKPVVALCMPVADRIDPKTFRSHRFLQRGPDVVGGWHHFDMIGFPVEVARNEITHAAVNHEPGPGEDPITHLLWIDDDMVFPADALKRMLGHNVPFVGGLCFDRRAPYKPVIARFFDKSWGFDPNTVGWLFDYPPDALIDVDATGGAFLLVSVEVFKAIREREIREQAEKAGNLTEEPLDDLRKAYRSWWTPLAWQGASEDFSFCYRAKQAGFDLKVDTGLKIGHVGEVVVDEAFAKRNRPFTYRNFHPPLDALLDAVRTRPQAEASQGMRDLDSPSSAPPAPVASIVIPVYNQRPEALVAAVQSALVQTVPVEVIVVDDGNDAEHDVLAALVAGGIHVNTNVCGNPEEAARLGAGEVRLVGWTTNRGIAAALNEGRRWATTDWFAWLSSDDLFDPYKIERHLSALLSAGAKCGYTGYNLVFDNGNLIGHVATPVFTSISDQMKALGRYCAFNGSTVMIHRDVFAKVGQFDPTYRYAQDWEFWCRAGEWFFWYGIPDKLTTRREFGNLTERLNRQVDPKKTQWRDAEDAAIRNRYGLHGRALAAVIQAYEVCEAAGHGVQKPCAACLAGIVERAF